MFDVYVTICEILCHLNVSFCLLHIRRIVYVIANITLKLYMKP